MNTKSSAPQTKRMASLNVENASLAELVEIKKLAEDQIEKKKADEIDRLRQQWTQEAAEINLTPEIVLGIEKIEVRKHRTSKFSPVDDHTKVYKKGPHPKWLKELLKKHKKNNVLELVEIGAMVANSDEDNS